ncbi:probable serine/threonine-protein kinase drkD isoform X2 [Aplysia californica]|uniref:Probable serine/threonine-protein kinase drkD isoform X2 n=1 Tax=Aplysia californica TaxID=6500 RepID=A0ABM0JCU8_APLCA|nr:probable serine/threonine-protein kinase drkD isoform X2 [Aplysia californica]
MMSVDIRNSERRRFSELEAREKEIAAGLVNRVSPPVSPKAQQENEKRMRREIANSNERRRMQCINAGFSSLRALIPQLEGEKLSKAAILQHTTEYITSLEKDKTRMQLQVEHLKHVLAELGQERVVTDPYISSSPPPSKRKKRDTESSDEGVGSLSDGSDEGGTELRQENVALQHQLEVERQRCASLEEHNRRLEDQLYSLLQRQSAQAIRELQPVKLEAAHSLTPHEPMYSREVVEVIASRDVRPPSPPPRPLSPTPERGMAMDISTPPMDTSRHEHSPPAAPSPIKPLPIQSPALDSNNSSVGGLVQPTVGGLVQPAARVNPPSVPEGRVPHHHNYCHRDHPRRRHRHQAQLEQQQAEEELRLQQQQKQQLQQQQQQSQQAVPAQSLENLVEAIRQIEGDGVLCQMEGERMVCDERKLYEEEQRLYTKRQSIPTTEESERETSSISDMDEFKSEGSGRDSPIQHHHHHMVHLKQQQQQPVIMSSQPPPPPPLSTTNSSSIHNSGSSSFSEKYPIASHLLHRPLHPSFYNRPGVIVHKQ